MGGILSVVDSLPHQGLRFRLFEVVLLIGLKNHILTLLLPLLFDVADNSNQNEDSDNDGNDHSRMVFD